MLLLYGWWRVHALLALCGCLDYLCLLFRISRVCVRLFLVLLVAFLRCVCLCVVFVAAFSVHVATVSMCSWLRFLFAFVCDVLPLLCFMYILNFFVLLCLYV